MTTIADWWEQRRKVEDTVDGWTVPGDYADYGPEEVHEMNRPIGRERHPMSQRFVEVVNEMIDLHDKKQSDYGRDTDPFANVRGSTEWDMPAWVGAMVRAQDKIRRLQQYNKKGTLANEGARDAFMDLAVYAVIALCLWEEEVGE